MAEIKIKKKGKAPAFALKDKDGKVHKLSGIESDHTVVYFYPKDNTPGCTLEAIDFTKNLAKLRKMGIEVVGISGGDEKTKTKFCKKHKLKLLLLSDTDNKVGVKYGVFRKKKFMGREYMGYNRVTFLLDKDKKIVHVWEKVKPLGHAKEVMEYVKNTK